MRYINRRYLLTYLLINIDGAWGVLYVVWYPNNSLYWNQVDNRNLLQWHIKQAAMQDSTALYNRTQSFGTQAFKSTKYNTSFSTER